MWGHVRDFLFLSFAVANGVFWGLLAWFFFLLIFTILTEPTTRTIG